MSFLLLCFASCLAVREKSREAYVVHATCVDSTAAPGYIYGALSIIGSIRKFDKVRDILVLVDAWTLLVYPVARTLFEANNAKIIVNQPLRHASRILPSTTPKNWLGSFAKLNLLQFSLMHYEVLLYADSDGTFLRPADELFALPFEDGIVAYGMRELCTDEVRDSRHALMGSIFIWHTRSGAVEMASHLIDLMFLTRSRLGYVPDDQRVLSLLFGNRLVLLDERLATNVIRCACKRENRGVTSLNSTIYAHFMNQVLNVNNVAPLVVEGKQYTWNKSTNVTSHETDCMGPAFRSWIAGLRMALAKSPGKKETLISRRYPIACPDTVPECSPFIQSSVVDMENLDALYDNDTTTWAACPTGVRINDFITIHLGFIHRQTTFELVRVEFAQSRVGSNTPVAGRDFVFIFDDEDHSPVRTGFIGRRVNSVTIKFVQAFHQEFSIREVLLTTMTTMTAQIWSRNIAEPA